MESHKTEDIIKPFKFIPENQANFNQKIEYQLLSKDDQIRMLLSFARAENQQDEQFNSNCCVICQNLAHDHLICSECETAIMCRSCKDQWQQQNKGKFQCPSCRSPKKPRNPSRMEIKFMDNIKVVCSFPDCQNREKPISLNEFKKHECCAINKTQECPQQCGQILESQNQQSHYEKCQNSVVQCLICSSQKKLCEIQDKQYLTLVEEIKQSERQFQKNVDQGGIWNYISEIQQQIKILTQEKQDLERDLKIEQEKNIKIKDAKQISDVRRWRVEKENEVLIQQNNQLQILQNEKSQKQRKNSWSSRSSISKSPPQRPNQLKKQMQNIFDKDPNISENASLKRDQEGKFCIDEAQKYWNVKINAEDIIIKQLQNIQIEDLNGTFNYNGMVKKENNQLFGYGRAIRTDKFGFIDGQFKNGKRHGVSIWINKLGEFTFQQWKNGIHIRNIFQNHF